MGSGAKTNWKTLSDVKREQLGQGEKVQCIDTNVCECVHEGANCGSTGVHMDNHSKQGLENQSGIAFVF